jgi:two-component sensor histidine kinase
MDVSTPESDAFLAWREADHRFLNTLTSLRGLLRTDFGSFADPAVQEAVAVFGSRIQAFASVHQTLQADAGEPLVDAPTHLARLCADLCAAHLAPRGVECELRSDPGRLSRDVSQKLSLIIVELVTNSAKHAFRGRTSGRVSVTFRCIDQDWVCQVADNGSGLRGDHKGAGTALVQALAHSLGGVVQVYSDCCGVVVTVSYARQAAGPPALGAPQ